MIMLGRKSSDTEFIISNNITLDLNQLTFQLLLIVSAPATQISFYTTVIHIQSAPATQAGMQGLRYWLYDIQSYMY